MHRRRRAPVWIAALAVLLHLCTMPLMAAHMLAMAVTDGQGTAAHTLHHHEAGAAAHRGHASEPASTQGHHPGMPCCCAAGSASLAAIPSGSPLLLEPQRVSLGNLPSAPAPQLSPRYRWPSLNPRASPIA